MLSLSSLLNPIKDEQQQLPSPCSTRYTTPTSVPRSPAAPPPKKQKVAKDAPVFIRGRVARQVRYPPFETSDSTFVAEFKRFSIYPQARISDFPRHIPYHSEKKDFLTKTCRDAFEVFQYTFKRPGEDKEYTVMWDYNIGLVRITPFFKCCNYAKTVPAKMLNMNLGLREICHSITGGALVAQGYWMPYDAAKAVATTFCYDIRYALAPVFGPDFVAKCIRPGGEGYGRMVIDPEIVRRCTSECREYREMTTRKPSPTPAPTTPTASMPQMRRSPITDWPGGFKYNAANRRALGLALGEYYTDTDNDSYLPSPHRSLAWSPGHQPRSEPRCIRLPPPDALLARQTLNRGYDAPPNSPDSSGSSNISPKTKKAELAPAEDMDLSLLKLAEKALSDADRMTPPAHDSGDTRAAWLLMKLKHEDAGLKGRVHSKKRRAASWNGSPYENFEE